MSRAVRGCRKRLRGAKTNANLLERYPRLPNQRNSFFRLPLLNQSPALIEEPLVLKVGKAVFVCMRSKCLGIFLSSRSFTAQQVDATHKFKGKSETVRITQPLSYSDGILNYG